MVIDVGQRFHKLAQRVGVPDLDQVEIVPIVSLVMTATAVRGDRVSGGRMGVWIVTMHGLSDASPALDVCREEILARQTPHDLVSGIARHQVAPELGHVLRTGLRQVPAPGSEQTWHKALVEHHADLDIQMLKIGGIDAIVEAGIRGTTLVDKIRGAAAGDGLPIAAEWFLAIRADGSGCTKLDHSKAFGLAILEIEREIGVHVAARPVAAPERIAQPVERRAIRVLKIAARGVDAHKAASIGILLQVARRPGGGNDRTLDAVQT